MFNPSRDEARRFFFDTWRKHQANDTLTDLERMTLAIILLHPEYHPVLDAPARYLEREWLPEDPRLTTPKNGMHWFWDPAHVKPSFGDEMQQRVFVTQQQDIGTMLTQQNIAQHLQQQTAALAQAQREDAAVREHIKKKLQSLNVWQHISADIH